MGSNTTRLKGTAQRGPRFVRPVAVPLLLALLAFGCVGMSTGQASSSASLRPATVSTQRADSVPALIALNGTM
jgi:hypothetical protein